MNLLSPGERRDFIEARLHVDWGWAKWEKGAGKSIRQIAELIGRAFPDSKAPSHMTVQRDIEWLKEDALGR